MERDIKRGECYPINPLFISTADVFEIPAKKEFSWHRKSKKNVMRTINIDIKSLVKERKYEEGI